MATVPRLNKTIIPTLADPAAIARAAQADPSAGALALGVAKVADVGLAFQRAKDASFVAEKSTAFKRDVDTFFRDFQIDAAGDPDARKVDFDKFVNDRFKTLSEGGSSEARAEFSRIRDNIVFDFDRKYQDFANKQNVRNFNNSFDNAIKDTALLAFRAGQDGDPLEEFLNNVDMASVAGSTFMPESDLRALNATSKETVAQEWAQGRIENNPVIFKEELDNGDHDNILTVDQIQSLGRLSDAAIEDLNNLEKKEKTQQKNELESQIDLSITTSKSLSDLVKVEQVLEQSKDILGVVSTNKRKAKIFTAREKLKEDVNLIERGSVFASGDAQLNPANKQDKRAYNAFYKSLLPILEQLSPAERNIAKAKIIDNARSVPDIIKGELSLAARSRDAEEIKNASDFIDRVTAINPHLIADLGSEKELARIQMVSQRIDAGIPPSQAIEATDRILDPKNAPTEEAVQIELATIRKSFSYRENAIESFESILPFGIGDPETEGRFVEPELDGLTARYRIVFEDHFRITRDKDVSKDYADKVIRGMYGNTNVNGFKQIMQFNPEKYYSISGENNKWMRKQMINDAFEATRNDIPRPTKKDLEDNLRLVVDPRVTPRSAAAGQPIYKLFWVRSDAPIDVLNGKFFKFDPDKRRKQLIEKAKKEK